jgi:hypothetical protein
MRLTLLAVALLCGLASSGLQLVAHHALSAHYRDTDEHTIEGVVVELVYRNPHAYVYVDAHGQAAGRRVWAVECGAPKNMLASRDRAAVLQPGDRVVVTGLPGRDPAMARLYMKEMVRTSDGRRWSGLIR